LIVLAAWLIPAGTTRGTAIALILVATLLTVVAKLLDGERALSFGHAFALALSIHALTKSEIFLAWPGSLLEALQVALLPALAAASLSLLARNHGVAGALAAGAFVAAAGGGWALEPTLALAAIAAGDQAASRWFSKQSSRRHSTLGWGDLTPAFAWVLGVGFLYLRGSLEVRSVALLLLALLVAATLRDRPWLTTGALLAVLVAGEFRTASGDLEAILGPEPLSWSATLATVLLVVLLLPALSLAPARIWLPLAVLALVTVRHHEGAPMAAGILAALAAFGPAQLGNRDGAKATRTPDWPRSWALSWAGTWFAGSMLAASYPWLRAHPLETFLSAVGISNLADRDSLQRMLMWSLIFVAVTLALAALSNSRKWSRGLSQAGTLQFGNLGAGVLLLLLGISTATAQKPSSNSLLPSDTVTLTEERFRWTRALDHVEAGQLVLKTNLAFAAELPAGQPVAAVRLHHPDGTFTQRPVEAGRDTSEWAVRRPDVAQMLSALPPEAWSSQVAAEGGVFAQRYRRVWYMEDRDLEGPAPVTRISVLRRKDLPPEVRLTLFSVELIP